ncbi:ABC transporter permease [Ekhidna sp.]|uniref:ABC transporter permease n=1 Tax=Ekhidna sp. TaxID=2608089 RepID=UPI003296CC81
MFNLEKEIIKWLKPFHKQRAFDEGSIHEMEMHLRDHIEDLIAQGLSERDAFQRAVEEFGDVKPLANDEYLNIKRKTTLRSILFRTMLSNYFKTTLRSMMKNPLSSFINIFGLAVAIGACMVTYAFINFDMGIDRFHENKDEVFLSTYVVNREGKEVQYGNAPAPLAEMIRDDFSVIEKVSRVHDGNAVVKYGDNVFHESVRYVDPAFLEMFTFPLKWGATSSLNDMNSIILSEEMSQKYFGDENPVGQEIKVIVGNDLYKVFKVAGVAKEFPKSRIIDFSFLTNIENMKVLYPSFDFHSWKKQLNATFIQVKRPEDLATIKGKMEKYKRYQNEVESDWPISSFDFVSLHDLHLTSDQIKNDISYDASEEGRVALPFIAGFILALACFNYLNIAIVSAAKRLKEIGMRKVIGASKRLIIFQFIAENLLLTFIAGIIGFILAVTIFLPWFAAFSDISSEFDLLDGNMWLTLFSILLFTGIASGVYPAFYISKFQVVKIFKGSVKFGKKNLATKIFLTAQLILTCVGIGFAVIFAQNTYYQENRGWGYGQKEVLYAEVQESSDLEKLKSEMVKEPGVISAAGSKHHLSKRYETTVVHLPNHQYEVHELAVGTNYLETLDVSLKEGRLFNKNQESDKKSLVVNETFVQNLALNQPIGMQVKIDSIPYQIVGVVEDFHFNNFYYELSPTIFTLADEEAHRFLTLKVTDQSKVASYKALLKTWSALFPEKPFNGGFQEDSWVGFYEELDTMQRFTRAIAIVFVLLASLGLYGLIQLNIKGRVREFSIRKTLGAAPGNLTKNVVNQYLIIFGIAIVLGIPAAHVMNTAMLEMMFEDPLPYGYLGSIISAVLLIFVLAAVIAAQVRKLSKANPVEGLKVE